MITEYPTELDGLTAPTKKPASVSTAQPTDAKKPKSAKDKKNEKEEEEEVGQMAANGQYYVEGDKVERQSQYLISTMASQNKVSLVFS